MSDATPLVALTAKSSLAVANLIAASHERPMDLKSVLPWDRGVDRSLAPKHPDQCWIYGTAHYDALAPAQRQELLWLEIARDVSMFISLEQTIPPLYMGYINEHRGRITPEVYEYLMIFSKEEIVHTLAFQRYMSLAGLKLFQPPDGLQELLSKQLPAMPPVAGILCTLVIEWVAELAAMYGTQSDAIEPFTRQLFYQHHVDEARHIGFGRWVGESYFESAPEREAQETRRLLQGVMARLIPQFTYNPEIAEHTSFRFPIARTDEAGIKAVRTSAANAALNEKRFAPIFSWLRKVQVMQ